MGLDSDKLLEVRNISKNYRDNKTELIKGLSFTLSRGEGVGLSGRNGSGKTTLLSIIAGLVKPDGGSISLYGRLSYVMQRDGLSGALSCLDNLRLSAALCGLSGKEAEARITELSDSCGLSAFLNKRVSRCSGGMRQRVQLATSLLQRPDVLLLDEASDGLDIESRELSDRLLYGFLQGGGAVLMVSHYEDELAKFCGRVIRL